VKVAGRDVLATWKVLISLGVAPVVYGFYAFLATAVAVRAGMPLKWRLWMPFLTLTVLPIMNYAALKFGEAGVDVLKSLRQLIVELIPGQQRSLDKLKAMRLRLANEVAVVINEFGPKLYDDFDEFRILVPSATAPPSTGTPGIWRRRSGTGAVDAQGNLLIHPMTWIDERLFGWSRSAKHGTSAWSGLHTPNLDSRSGTPNETDDEEAPDYDNVLGFFPDQEQPGTSKSRSRNNSYADIQRLRITNADATLNPTPSLVVGEGLHPRRGHRSRKHSLSDSVAVDRIAATDGQEPFKDATSDINNEIRQTRPECLQDE